MLPFFGFIWFSVTFNAQRGEIVDTKCHYYLLFAFSVVLECYCHFSISVYNLTYNKVFFNISVFPHDFRIRFFVVV